MKEDIFFKVGINTSYLEEAKQEKWTSRVRKKINQHGFILSLFLLIIICLIMNFWLIYSFINILSNHV